MAITTEWHWLCAMTKLSARDAAWHAGVGLNVCGAIDGVRGLNSAPVFRARSYLRFPRWCVFRPLAEIGDISPPEHAASWANAALAAKNSLTASDAKIVEDAFERRLSQLGSSSEATTSSDDDGSGPESGSYATSATAKTRTRRQTFGPRHRQKRARRSCTSALSRLTILSPATAVLCPMAAFGCSTRTCSDLHGRVDLEPRDCDAVSNPWAGGMAEYREGCQFRGGSQIRRRAKVQKPALHLSDGVGRAWIFSAGEHVSLHWRHGRPKARPRRAVKLQRRTAARQRRRA